MANAGPTVAPETTKKPDLEEVVKEGNVRAKAEAAQEAEAQTKVHELFTLRTGLSALIYGVIGALVGRLIGRLGDLPDRAMGSRFMPWFGGFLGVFLAAFTSMKTTKREQREEDKTRQAAHAKASEAPAAVPSAPAQTPAAQVGAVEHTGIVGSTQHTLTV